MLTSMDETLLHQEALPMAQTAVSDHRFFDRTVVGCHSADGTKIVTGFAVYKNMNVFESFACVQRNGKQYNLRRSRALLPDVPEKLLLPPISLDVVEPLKQLKLGLAAGDEWQTSYELDWAATYPAHMEAPHFNRKDGRVYENFLRFDQLAVVNGSLSVAGENIEIRDWFGWRDHSWGVRPDVGNYEPVTDDAGEFFDLPGADGSLMVMLWFSADGIAGNFHVIEDGFGNPVVVDGNIKFPEHTGKSYARVTSVEHDIHFYPDSRIYDTVNLKVTTADGNTYDVKAEAAGSPWTFKGTGYSEGYNDEKGLGVYRGEDLLEVDVYDVSDPTQTVLPDGRVITPAHREQPVSMSINGAQGFGYMPIFAMGRIRRYGMGDE